MRTKAQQLRNALQGIERLRRYLAVCHRDIDSLEREVIHLRAAAREASFNKGRVAFLEAQIEAMAEAHRAHVAMLEQQLTDAKESRDLAWRMRESACETIEQIAPIARESKDRQAEIVMLYQRVFGLEERLEAAEAKLAIVQSALQIEQLIEELVTLRRIRHLARSYRDAEIECMGSFAAEPRLRSYRRRVELDALLGIPTEERGAA